VCFVAFPLTREEQAEAEMRLERVWVDLDGTSIESGCSIELILMVGHVSGIEEGSGVVGMGKEVRVEFGGSGFPVRTGDSGFGFCEAGGNLGRIWCGSLRLRRLGKTDGGCAEKSTKNGEKSHKYLDEILSFGSWTGSETECRTERSTVVFSRELPFNVTLEFQDGVYCLID